MDPLIERYVQQLKTTGHHFGHDPRRHNHRNLWQQPAQEEEGEQPREGLELREEQGHQAPAPRAQVQAPRDYLALREKEPERKNHAHGHDDGIVQQRVKRRHVFSDAHRHSAAGTHTKKHRISVDEGQAPDGGQHERMEAQELKLESNEGSDLSGHHEYANGNRGYVFVPYHDISSFIYVVVIVKCTHRRLPGRH